MITERTLRQWRRDALKKLSNPLMKLDLNNPASYDIAIALEAEYCNRILRLTQELMDIQLVRKG